MNKQELVTAIAAETGLTKKDVAASIEALVTTVQNELVAGGEVKISNFGTFCVTERAARMGHNPKTGEQISIDASKTPKFKASGTLKKSINE